MKLLILGGTQFVGRHITAAALHAGHEVTLLNRGKTNPELFPDVEKLVGNRQEGDLTALKGRNWDAVIDVNGYMPKVVRESALALRGHVGHYTFISTISVYAEPIPYHFDENAPLMELASDKTEELSGETYGAQKVLCEQAVQALFPDSATIIRPGLVVGPHDHTDRFTYWVVRVAQGGEVLAPIRPSFPIQFIDARDLAAFSLQVTIEKVGGVYNATGPDNGMPIGRLFEACERATGSGATFTYLPEDFLIAQEIQPWLNLPMWLPEAAVNMNTTNIQRALAAGLRLREVEATVRDTLDWLATGRPMDKPFRFALDPEKEAAVLKLWHEKRISG